MFYNILQSAVQVYSIDTQFSNILARLEGGVPSTGHNWDCVATIQYLNQKFDTDILSHFIDFIIVKSGNELTSLVPNPKSPNPQTSKPRDWGLSL